MRAQADQEMTSTRRAHRRPGRLGAVARAAQVSIPVTLEVMVTTHHSQRVSQLAGLRRPSRNRGGRYSLIDPQDLTDRAGTL